MAKGVEYLRLVEFFPFLDSSTETVIFKLIVEFVLVEFCYFIKSNLIKNLAKIKLFVFNY